MIPHSWHIPTLGRLGVHLTADIPNSDRVCLSFTLPCLTMAVNQRTAAAIKRLHSDLNEIQNSPILNVSGIRRD